MSIDDRVLWVSAGGKCTLCKADLLRGRLTGTTFPLGEKAHNVGRSTSPRSPRGDDPLPVTERDKVENLLLVCARCHGEIDHQIAAGLLTVKELGRRKDEHERDVRLLLDKLTESTTAVFRVQGGVRGMTTSVSVDDASRAVITSSSRWPSYAGGYDVAGVGVDLRGLADEDVLGEGYYTQACRLIDQGVTRIKDGVAQSLVQHVSVFALARLPLLIYLGVAMRDALPADIYQRHRATTGWAWPEHGATVTFTTSLVRDGAGDGAVIFNLTGTTPQTALPPEVAAGPLWEITASGIAEDVIASSEDLAAFERTVRELITGLEATHKTMPRLHVFGSLPVSAAVTLGRVLKARDLRPAVVTYEFMGGRYQQALEV